MPSDVKLDGEKVIVVGDLEVGQINAQANNQLKIKGWDLILDGPDRRGTSADPKISRRALVHDYGDKLTINYGNDYPGGVMINGKVVASNIYVNSITSAIDSTKTYLSINSRIYATKGLTVGGEGLSVGGVRIKQEPSHGSIFGGNPGLQEELEITGHTIRLKSFNVITSESELVLDLVDEIRKLRNEVDELKKK